MDFFKIILQFSTTVPVQHEALQAWENVFQLGAISKAAHKLGADNTRILAKFSFELIILYVFAPELVADQSVCQYTFSRAFITFDIESL